MSFGRNKAKFADWINRHYRGLYRHALWMTGHSDIAADLVQETLYQAWKGHKVLRDESKVRPWLYTILRRNLAREYSDKCWSQTMLDQLRYETLSLTDNQDRDMLMDLTRLFGQLSPAHREVLLLYALHGYSYAEISRQLNIPAGTVMSRLARARNALKSIQAQKAAVAESGEVVVFPVEKKESP